LIAINIDSNEKIIIIVPKNNLIKLVPSLNDVIPCSSCNETTNKNTPTIAGSM
jgi:hypothetical protein